MAIISLLVVLWCNDVMEEEPHYEGGNDNDKGRGGLAERSDNRVGHENDIILNQADGKDSEEYTLK